MSTPVLADGTEVRTSPATARPLLLGAMAALSAGAGAIHFAVMFEHFDEYSLYGVFFLVLAWAQLVWPVVLIALPFLTWTPARARPARFPVGWSRWDTAHGLVMDARTSGVALVSVAWRRSMSSSHVGSSITRGGAMSSQSP